MHRSTSACCLLFVFVAAQLVAQDYRAETIDSPAPADELAPAIVGALSPTGVRVVRGESRVIWELWPTKTWSVEANFQPTLELLYPFQPGQLMGVLRLPRRGADFRDQRIDRGVYTLRYMQQPVDGNHVGTSPTRDFFLLVRADADQSTDLMDPEELNIASADAAQSTHPAMLSLQPVAEASGAKLPSIRHDEERDWWILRFGGKTDANGEQQELVVSIVAEGHAPE